VSNESQTENTKKNILIVDDEPGIRDSLRLILQENFTVVTAANGLEAVAAFDKQTPDLVLLDVTMPELDGIETLKRLRDEGKKAPVIMLSAINTAQTAVQAIKFGALDYVNKPFDIPELTTLIIQTLAKNSITEVTQAEENICTIVGNSSPIVELKAKINQIATHDATVLITGESGTGKELVARAIHQASNRKDKQFVAINCAAIPESLIESELFGHEKGAFTHAVDKRIGHCELADGGTLFLDEIGELSLTVQVKLLRFLQSHEFYRVGSSKSQKVNIRVLAATNRNLEQAIKEQAFRQDLFYRLNVINLHIPSLKDRYEDVPELIEYMKGRFSKQYPQSKVAFSADSLRALIEYDWPGNVRELENMIESFLALGSEAEIQIEDLPAKVRQRQITRASIENKVDFSEAERNFEKEIISKALRRANFIQTRAAELLGISRRILKYKMDKLGIVAGGDA